MLNIISILGPSRSGKSAILPLVSSSENFELPFNTPDLDWYVETYLAGEIDIKTLCKLSVNYMLCYSWYSYLGRHINLRPDDMYSLQRMKPSASLDVMHSRQDKDLEFSNFLKANDNLELWNIFQWDLPPEVFEILENEYPIDCNPIYCYRSPYYLFTSWISSNRVKRSQSLSRMLKIEATESFRRNDLLEHFEPAGNDKEAVFEKSLGTYKFFEFNFDNIEATDDEQASLISLIEETRRNADYWFSRGMAVHFEALVSRPEQFVGYISDRFGAEFEAAKLNEAILLMNKRPISEVLVTDEEEMRNTLSGLNCSKITINKIIDFQKDYISGFTVMNGA